MVSNGIMDTSTNGPAPVLVSNSNAPPPFLSKTYDMVDDSSTDAIVSWSPTNNSFVVWNPPEFARDLLPKYFKHNNFSSFVRQLNTYGFRKVDPDRWEFANEGFLRGQKHLLKSITRRKPAHGQGNQHPQQSQDSSVGCVEVGKFGLEEEIERLKRDKNVLMQELVRLRQQQQATDNQLQATVQRLQGMEQRQQQMMSFMAKAVQSPGFFAQFVQNQNDSRRISEANKKRRIKQGKTAETKNCATPDGQIVKYQPQGNDAAKAMPRQIMKADKSQLKSCNKPESLLISDGSSSSDEINNGSSSTQVSGVTLQEVPPTPGQSALIPETSGIGEEAPSISIPQEDDIIPELSQIPEIIPESIADIPVEEDYVGSETRNSEFIDPTSLELTWTMPLDIDNISPSPDINALLDDSDFFWDDLLVQSLAQEEMESTSAEGVSKENDSSLTEEKKWEKGQNMEKLTEQRGLLTSDTTEV